MQGATVRHSPRPDTPAEWEESLRIRQKRHHGLHGPQPADFTDDEGNGPL